ncbi:MAG: SDR family NAD(P)-dependent oxidoreductase [Bacteroidota bacterium]
MKRKVCVVTGACRGLGYATALAFAKKGASVIMVCPMAKCGQDAAERIRVESGNPYVDLYLTDLADLHQIRALAISLMYVYPRIDVLVHNAATFRHERTISPDGYEYTFAVNYLAPFLLTHLLMPAMEQSFAARIISVADTSLMQGFVNLNDLQSTRHYKGHVAYRQSKLASLMFIQELTQRLNATRITANCVSPGTITSDLIPDPSKLPWHMQVTHWLNRSFRQSPKEACRYILNLALSPMLSDVKGTYYHQEEPVRFDRPLFKQADAKALWETTEKMVALTSSERILKWEAPNLSLWALT